MAVIEIETGLDTSQIKNDLKDVERLIASLEKKLARQKTEVAYYKQMMKQAQTDEEVGEWYTKFARAEEAVRKTEFELQSAKDKQADLNAEAEKMPDTYEETEKNIKKSKKAIEKFINRVKSLVASMLVFNVISKGLRELRTYLSNALNSNEEFQKSVARLKGTLLTAFMPIYNTIIPWIISLMNVLNSAANALANFSAKIFGTTREQAEENAKALYEESKGIDSVGSSAKSASKQMASFDTINKLGSSDSAGGASDSSGIDFSGGVGQELGKMEAIIAGSLMAIGLILMFTGHPIVGAAMVAAGAAAFVCASDESKEDLIAKAEELLSSKIAAIAGAALVGLGVILMMAGHPLIGIAMIATGAATLFASAALNKDAIKKTVEDALKSSEAGVIGAIAGAAMVAIGILLCMAGNLPLGIGLIAAGAASLVTAVTLHWDAITSALAEFLTPATGLIIGGALIAIGLLLCFGGNLPLGIALIAAGAGTIFTAFALNWDAILEKLKEVWAKIVAWWNTTIAPIFTAEWWSAQFASILLAAKNLTKDINDFIVEKFNKLIDWLNDALDISWNAITIAGVEIVPAGHATLLRLPHIPKLAEGAVIPPNREFLATLGDQRSGTNIETPLDTMIEAFQRAGANQAINIRFTGDLAELARILKPEIEKESNRTGTSVVMMR